jgi:hypothetical protein
MAQSDESDEFDHYDGLDEDGEYEEYKAHGNVAATYDPSMQIREGNRTVWFVNAGKPTIWNFYVK